jgi:hypothetical protein
MSAWLQPGAARASDNVVEFKRALTVVDAAGGTHQVRENEREREREKERGWRDAKGRGA